jgi:adenosylcobinamide-GDP ribazoletransferase
MMPKPVFYALLFLMPVYARGAMVPPMHHGWSARKEGLGRIFIQNIEPGALLFSQVITLLLAVVVYFFWLRSPAGGSRVFLLLGLFMALYLFGYSVARCSRNKFGGLTGDIFGAVTEISEVIYLLGVSFWLRRFS